MSDRIVMRDPRRGITVENCLVAGVVLLLAPGVAGVRAKCERRVREENAAKSSIGPFKHQRTTRVGNHHLDARNVVT